MARSEHISCDNENCNGGKYFHQCGNEHDICSLCSIELVQDSEDYYCPICLKKALLCNSKSFKDE